MIYYANADKTAIVPEDSPDAKWVVNGDAPEDFGPLLQAHLREEREKAQAEAEERDKRGAAASEKAENSPPSPVPTSGATPENEPVSRVSTRR